MTDDELYYDLNWIDAESRIKIKAEMAYATSLALEKSGSDLLDYVSEQAHLYVSDQCHVNPLTRDANWMPREMSSRINRIILEVVHEQSQKDAQVLARNGKNLLEFFRRSLKKCNTLHKRFSRISP